MNIPEVTKMESLTGEKIALESLTVDASLQGLFSNAKITQIYKNEEKTNIEAVYTFPLPLDAVLLDLTLEINGKCLKGVVKPKQQAEDNYEDAIDEGDTAVLLTQKKPGLYVINVGNLQANERAVIKYHYAQLLVWQGDSLRYYLPTTIAPRYGDPFQAGLESHEVPEYTHTPTTRFQFALQITGILAKAAVNCPSHTITMEKIDNSLLLSMEGGMDLMDRDFICEIRQTSVSGDEGFYAQDGDGYVALAAFHPKLPKNTQQTTRQIKLVIDCSGSMEGDSIYQAKQALTEILSQLNSKDRFNITAFGSDYELLFNNGMQYANGDYLQQAMQFVQNLDANMGGTEIESALMATFNSEDEIDSADVLLITDGEVWAGQEAIINAANAISHRIFTVGVGYAVAEDFVRGLAEATGAACELVSPQENMAERIVRHFQRIDQPVTDKVMLQWPMETKQQLTQSLERIYSGDTLHLWAWFDKKPIGKAQLVLQFPNGEKQIETLELSKLAITDQATTTSPLSRVAAMAKIKMLNTLSDKEKTELAVYYQLVSNDTSYVLVYEREEADKVKAIPQLRKVPHAMKASKQRWIGGKRKPCPLEHDTKRLVDLTNSLFGAFSAQNNDMSIDIPTPISTTIDVFIQRLNLHYPANTTTKLDFSKIVDLENFGLSQKLADELRQLVDYQVNESSLVKAFLLALESFTRQKKVNKYKISRHPTRLIRKLSARVDETIKDLLLDWVEKHIEFK